MTKIINNIVVYLKICIRTSCRGTEHRLMSYIGGGEGNRNTSDLKQLNWMLIFRIPPLNSHNRLHLQHFWQPSLEFRVVVLKTSSGGRRVSGVRCMIQIQTFIFPQRDVWTFVFLGGVNISKLLSQQESDWGHSVQHIRVWGGGGGSSLLSSCKSNQHKIYRIAFQF